ncbi:hypothetical protein MO973_25760 [Paenibacillus sp. TRM 82003]|nr:hypothetical protein [Paenibacillus sp. TRM 82003]
MKTKAAVMTVVIGAILALGWLAERDVRDARYAESNARSADDHPIVQAYDLKDLPIFRSREYVKIIRLQDNLEP